MGAELVRAFGLSGNGYGTIPMKIWYRAPGSVEQSSEIPLA